MRACFFLLGALLLAPACSGDDSASGAGGAGAGAAGGAGGDAGGGPAGGGATCESHEAPSTRAVSFVLTNEAGADRYVLVEGSLCDPFTIVGNDGADPVTFFAPDNTCNCECAGPPPSGPARLRLLANGEGATIAWDARTLELCSYEEVCDPSMTATAWMGWPVPVGDGQYEATFQIFDAAPAYCQPDPGAPGDVVCSLDTVGSQSCEGSSQAQATFTLGADDMDVPVTVAP